MIDEESRPLENQSTLFNATFSSDLFAVYSVQWIKIIEASPHHIVFSDIVL